MEVSESLVRVFVVEDHPVMRTMLCETIERHPQCRLLGTAASAEEALEALSTLEVDLALIDVSLPRMSGIDLVRCLKERPPEVRCLMVSGHVEPSYAMQALDAGACGYVLKGNPADLDAAIAACNRGEVYLSPPLEHRVERLEETREHEG